jgi:hypothetical protein
MRAVPISNILQRIPSTYKLFKTVGPFGPTPTSFRVNEKQTTDTCMYSFHCAKERKRIKGKGGKNIIKGRKEEMADKV